MPALWPNHRWFMREISDQWGKVSHLFSLIYIMLCQLHTLRILWQIGTQTLASGRFTPSLPPHLCHALGTPTHVEAEQIFLPWETFLRSHTIVLDHLLLLVNTVQAFQQNIPLKERTILSATETSKSVGLSQLSLYLLTINCLWIWWSLSGFTNTVPHNAPFLGS